MSVSLKQSPQPRGKGQPRGPRRPWSPPPMEASLPTGRQIESAFAPTSPSSPTRSTRACLLPIISPHRAGRPKALANSPPDWLLCGSSPVGMRLSPSLSGNRSPFSHRFHARPSGAKHCSGASLGRLTCQPQLSQGNRSSHSLGWRQAAGGPENLPSQVPWVQSAK